MYFDPEDKERILDYLESNKGHFKTLKPIKQLSKMKDKLLKKYDSSFHEDIEIEYLKGCRLAVAEDISRNTGLATDGIMFTIESLGMDKFKKLL